MSLKDVFLSGALVALFQWSGTICAILVMVIMRNNSVKLFLIWTSGSGVNVIKRHFLSRALAAPLFGGVEPFVHF